MQKVYLDLKQPMPSVSSTNKSDRHDITEILLKSGIKHQKPVTCTVLTAKTEHLSIQKKKGGSQDGSV